MAAATSDLGVKAAPAASPDISVSGDPRQDSRAFRRCLGEFATGITVITASSSDERAGVTVNSFSSLSLDPPLVVWSLKRTSRSRQVFERADSFAVNILAIDQIGVSQEFSGEAVDKFANVSWKPGHNSQPRLDGVLAFLSCRVVARHDGGDHILFVGEVAYFEKFAGKPLLFVQGAYGAATDHPTLTAKEPVRVAEEPYGEDREIPFTALLSRTYHMLTLRFSEQRQVAGVTENEYRVLAGLYDYGQITADELEERRHFPRSELNDALAELTRRGDVRRSANDRLELTEQGRQRRLSILAQADKFRAKQLAGISPTELDAARNVLSKLLRSKPPKDGVVWC